MEYGDPVQVVCDQFDIDYQTVNDAPDGVDYRFASRYPAVEEGAVADIGRYAAVLDATVEDWDAREQLYRQVVAGRDASYLPDTTDRDDPAYLLVKPDDITIEEAAFDRHGLKHTVACQMQHTDTVDRDWGTFVEAYNSTLEYLQQSLDGRNSLFKC